MAIAVERVIQRGVTTLRLYDSARGQKVVFEPLVAGQVRMYLCGPTTYAPAHIGHAYSAIAFDTIRRALKYLGFVVTFVRNVTDVDDKIIKAAQATGEDPVALAARFADDYNRDMARFFVLPPDVEPRVSGHIPEIIAVTQRLIERGHAYVAGNDVYFAVETFPTYGQLSGQTLDQLRAGARVDVDERKRSPADFALWKGAKPGEPSWESPWGPGRPGWHIECSAMTYAHLGDTFDIHGGGKDLIFPHHENEIAQSQGAHGPGTFARYWLHNGFLNFSGEKMSKSLGNVFGCTEIAAAVGGEALRFFCVSHHYRSPVDFEIATSEVGGQTVPRFTSLEGADRRLDYFYTTLQRIDALTQNEPVTGAPPAEASALVQAARDALADDFNAPVVVAALGEAARVANKWLDEKGGNKDERRQRLGHLAAAVRSVGAALGVLTSAPSEFLRARRARLCERRQIAPAWVAARMTARATARAAKDYAGADAVRAELTAAGVELLDTPAGTDWRVIDDAPALATV